MMEVNFLSELFEIVFFDLFIEVSFHFIHSFANFDLVFDAVNDAVAIKIICFWVADGVLSLGFIESVVIIIDAIF